MAKNITTPAPGRVIIDFDNDWKFQRADDDPAMKEPGFDDSKWKKLNVPHDWAIEGTIKRKKPVFDVPVLQVLKGKWLFDKGDAMEKKDVNYDDAKWQEVTLPQAWEKHSNYTEDNVYGWYRRAIEIPAKNAGADVVLDLGCIDDVDEAYFNGELIGKTGAFPPLYMSSWNTQRFYRVPASLIKKGKNNIIAIRVFDGYGEGGMRLFEPESFIDGPFDRGADGGNSNGFLPGGTGWYRKEFTVPETMKGKMISVEFDGVYMDSDAWINGEKLGNHPYGYTSFSYDLTPFLKYGNEKNVIALRLNVIQQCTRWYSGAGIYRHVRLSAVDAVHTAKWGTYITVPDISENEAKVIVETKVENAGAEIEVKLETTILDKNNSVCAKTESTEKTGREKKFRQELKIQKPLLWSLDNPDLYIAESRVLVNGVEKDKYTTAFGVRSIKFTEDKGFFLNGKHVPIKGVCLHHDNGYLGTAVHKRAIQRQIEIMKEMGCNAIRTSHNPPDPVLLDLCDSMGMLVMDEAFDEWKENKTNYGYGRFFDEWGEKDLTSMLLRDRNHPSIIIWSIGNEIAEQWAGTPEDAEARTKMLADICRAVDPTRPVTAACNNVNDAIKKNMAKHLDVFGINYNPWAYEKEKGKWKLIGTETASTVSTRGTYNLVIENGEVLSEPEFDNQVSSYDNFAPQWATIAWESLKAVENAPWMAGEFVWTGFDYIGEPTPFWWPSAISYFGIVDLCGFPKDRFYLYQSRWSDKPMVHLLPHWNWDKNKFKGLKIPVYVYTNCESAELIVNGKSAGEKKMSESGNLRLEWEVPYVPGVIRVIGKNNGKEVCRKEHQTAGAPYKIELTADRKELSADGEDLLYVTARIVDSRKNLCSTADNEVEFEIEGDGIIAATGNGNPVNHAFFNAKKCKAFNGMLLCIVKAGKNPSHLLLSATGKGLDGAEVDIITK